MSQLAEEPSGNNLSFSSEKGSWGLGCRFHPSKIHFAREKHGPESQTAEPPILKDSLGAKRPLVTQHLPHHPDGPDSGSASFVTKTAHEAESASRPSSPDAETRGWEGGRQARFWQGAVASPQLAARTLLSSARTLPTLEMQDQVPKRQMG